MTVIDQGLMEEMWPQGNDKIDGLIEGIVKSMPVVFPKYDLTNDLVVAHFMAQVSHECDAGLEVVENLNYSAQGLMRTWPRRFDEAKANRFAHQPQAIANEVYNNRMGNEPGSNDGWNYRGRGAAQTTGRENYEKLGEIMGVDLVGDPNLVNSPDLFLECGAADFVRICNCLPPAQEDDIVTVTKRLNGGLIGLDQRRRWLRKWKGALSVDAVA